MARRKVKPEKPEGEQPGQNRVLVKLPKETHTILKQLAALRGENLQACIHFLLVEEVRRKLDELKGRIDIIANLPAPNSENDDD